MNRNIYLPLFALLALSVTANLEASEKVELIAPVIRIDQNTLLFPIYGHDENLMERTINFYLPIASHFSLHEKIRHLCQEISRFRYQHLPIRLETIETREDKKIAIIHLNEGKNTGASWKTGYFQGSANNTTYTLRESILQRGYTGEWIDGVEFYYEGKPIQDGVWDHIFLHGTHDRDERLNH